MCHAYQSNDQMCCGRCGTQWDVNDQEPPACVSSETGRAARREYVAFIKNTFGVKSGSDLQTDIFKQ